MKFFAKVHRAEREVVVAVCDREVRGESFAAGEAVLEVKEGFYGNELYDRDAVIPILKEATILNLVGRHIIDLAIELGLIEKENVIKLGGTVHAQMVRM